MSTLLARSRQHAEQAINAVQYWCHTAFANVHTAWRDEDLRPRRVLYVALAVVASVWLAVKLLLQLRNRTRQSTTPPSTPNLEKRSPFRAAERKPGGIASHSTHFHATNPSCRFDSLLT